MMDQYRRIKRDHQGEVLFFRLGDFYEMFFEDAIEVSALLNLTLTQRQGYPMCGIPYHASRSYIGRLLKAGKKIAICEQLNKKQSGKAPALMERQVVEVITPGTTVDEDFLDRGNSNYMACLAYRASFFSFSYIDLSIGDFYTTSFPSEMAVLKLRQELERLSPKEIIVQESLLNDFPLISLALTERSNLVINRWADWLFEAERAKERLERQFSSIKAYGLDTRSPELLSSGALLEYIDESSKTLLPHIRSIKIYKEDEYVNLDEATQRNLELVRNLMDGDTRFTLLEVMDETKTAMGKRLLKNRILSPLCIEELIKKRLDMTEYFYKDQDLLARLREILAKTPDLERLSSRLAMDKAHGKDLAAIKNALVFFITLNEKIASLPFYFESEEARSLNGGAIKTLCDIKDMLENSIAEDPSILLSEGNLIKDNYNSELDSLKVLRDSGRSLLEAYMEEERVKTGITALKIRYNRLIGYYFEVNNVNLSRVPSYFIRRQGIAGGERFTTDRLASLESDINGASDKIIELERKLFLEIRDKTKNALNEISSAARLIAELDFAASLAWSAAINGWTRPLLNNKKQSHIVEGRHPVVEAHLRRGEFIPNDLKLDTEDRYFALITGPNMAGKSTYLRQAALITIMAQMGSYVPAREAVIGIVDRIYCRVGAQDNLARGESTFLVEMSETAYILNTATESSLVIMDEVGRGTGTRDGLSIAWAVCEEILDNLKCRTLFATHYHELSGIVHKGMANVSMDVAEQNGEIVFLRKLKEGPTAESYGLHVAAMAGLKYSVILRAEEIMASLGGIVLSEVKCSNTLNAKEMKIINELEKIDINNVTPVEALNMIQKWKNLNAEKARAEKANTEKKEDNLPSLFD